MKGTIVKAAEKLIISKFGIEKWEEILEKSGYDIDHFFFIREDVDEEKVLNLVNNACEILHLSQLQLFDSFAEYWINKYMGEVYPNFKFDTAKEFINKISTIHKVMTENIPNAMPPNFDYNWINDNELIMTYHSKRGMIDLAVSLIKHIGFKYNEEIVVEKLNDKEIKVVFKS